jgi:hypothetical protein
MQYSTKIQELISKVNEASLDNTEVLNAFFNEIKE